MRHVAPTPPLRIVVDANPVYAALLRDGTARRLALDPRLRLFAPRHLEAEVRRHLPEIARRNTVSEDLNAQAFRTLLSRVSLIQLQGYFATLPAVLESLPAQSSSDMHYLAVAAALDLDGVWSDDLGLRGQNRIRVYTTPELAVRFPPGRIPL